MLRRALLIQANYCPKRVRNISRKIENNNISMERGFKTLCLEILFLNVSWLIYCTWYMKSVRCQDSLIWNTLASVEITGGKKQITCQETGNAIWQKLRDFFSHFWCALFIKDLLLHLPKKKEGGGSSQPFLQILQKLSLYS